MSGGGLWVSLVGIVALCACRSPCEKLVDEFCAIDAAECLMAKESSFLQTLTPERERHCRIQLQELGKLPLPHTHTQLVESADKSDWRTTRHPIARVAGLPTGYTPRRDWIWQDVFSAVLEASAEPSFSEVTEDSLRFTWAPSMKGTAFVVRASKGADGATIDWKRLDRAGEAAYFSPAQVATSNRRPLTTQEWNDLVRRAILVRPLPSQSDRHGEDGSEWLFESTLDGGYAFAQRWSPEDTSDPDFRALCLRLVSLGTPDGGTEEPY